MLKKSPWSRDNHNDHAHDLYAVNDDDDDDDDDSLPWRVVQCWKLLCTSSSFGYLADIEDDGN